MAKKNPLLELCLGGNPLKTRYLPHFNHFSIPVLLFQHSWHASSLTCLSFHTSLSKHLCMSLLWIHTLSISQANEGSAQAFVSIKLQVKVKLTSYHPGFWSNSALSLHGQHTSIKDLGSIIPEKCPFHLAWDDKVVWSQCPRPPLSLQVEDDKVIHEREGSNTPITSNLPTHELHW